MFSANDSSERGNSTPTNSNQVVFAYTGNAKDCVLGGISNEGRQRRILHRFGSPVNFLPDQWD
jgi:hypothetical protein